MKKENLVIPAILILCMSLTIGDFRSTQKQFSRVKEAYLAKESILRESVGKIGLTNLENSLFIRVFKKEKTVEAWLKGKGKNQYIHFKDYKISCSSGVLGPKRKKGDDQVPEGFYHVNVFQPKSKFHLSLQINYPNQSDLILGDKNNPGNEIFIHGGYASIGCIPITDDCINELYVLAVEARNSGQEKIPVHIFPTKLSDQNLDSLNLKFSQDSILTKFRKNLKPGFDFFETNKKLPTVTVAKNGKYIFK